MGLIKETTFGELGDEFFVDWNCLTLFFGEAETLCLVVKRLIDQGTLSVLCSDRGKASRRGIEVDRFGTRQGCVIE